MTDIQQRSAARQFVQDWTGRGDEKQETAQFWTALLQKGHYKITICNSIHQFA